MITLYICLLIYCVCVQKLMPQLDEEECRPRWGAVWMKGVVEEREVYTTGKENQKWSGMVYPQN